VGVQDSDAALHITPCTITPCPSHHAPSHHAHGWGAKPSCLSRVVVAAALGPWGLARPPQECVCVYVCVSVLMPAALTLWDARTWTTPCTSVRSLMGGWKWACTSRMSGAARVLLSAGAEQWCGHAANAPTHTATMTGLEFDAGAGAGQWSACTVDAHCHLYPLCVGLC